MRLTIGQKALLTMLGVAVPSLLLFSALILHSRGEILRENISRQLKELAVLSVRTVDDLVASSKQTALAIAASPDVRTVVRDLERKAPPPRLLASLARLEQSFLDFQKIDRTLQAIRFIDARGLVLAKVREDTVIPRTQTFANGPAIPVVSSKASRDFFKNAVTLGPGQVWISNMERGWMEGEEYWCPAMVRFATPVFFANGKVAGVVVINVWGEAVGKMINRLILPEEGSAFLVERNLVKPERNGIYLFHPQRSCEFGNQTGSRITMFQHFPPSITDSWLHQEQGINRHPQSQDILVHHFYSPYNDPKRGWVIVVNAKSDFYLAPLATMKRRMLLSAGIILLLIITASLIFSRTLTRPIKKVIEGTHRISQDLSQRIEVKSSDEVGALAGEINEMAATLARNLEEKQRVEEQICQSEKLASIGEMAAGLAHELNTPLGNIRALAALARKDLTPEAADLSSLTADLSEIITQTDRCSRILGGLLSFARKQESEFGLHDLNDLVAEAISLVKIKADKKQARITFTRNPSLPLLTVDGHQIEQVCVNLLLNALDAVEPGGVITVSSRSSQAVVSLHFKDDGCGIDPKLLPRIFDPFFTTKGVGKGTGLGLSLSYGIIKNHGGTIDVLSEPGEGAEFIIILPVTDKETHP